MWVAAISPRAKLLGLLPLRILKMPDLPKRLRVSWIFKYGVVCVCVCVYVSWLKCNFGRDFDVYFWKFIVVNYQNHFLMVSNKIARVSL